MTLAVKLFCPVCGHPMTQRQGYYYCEKGDFGLSKFVQEALLEAIAATPAAPPDPKPEEKHHLAGHCPRCGTRAIVTDHATRVCPQCGLKIRAGIFYAIREYLSHKP
jgi:ribosomal protein S27AE